MVHARLRTRIAILLAFAAGGVSRAQAAQPGVPPAAQARALDQHTYQAALAGLGYYQGCGRDAGELAALTAQFHSIEAAARAKGLGPTLDIVRQQYQNMLAVEIRMARCGRDRVSPLVEARRTMADFQAWVASAAPVVLTPAQREAEIVRTIVALEDAYAAAEIARGESALRRVLDEHFSAPSRVDQDRTRELALLDGVARTAVYREAVTERQVALSGDTATVNGIVAITYSAPTGAPVSRFRFTETYRSSDGIWSLVSRELADRPLP
jgi:hypothetical protein